MKRFMTFVGCTVLLVGLTKTTALAQNVSLSAASSSVPVNSGISITVSVSGGQAFANSIAGVSFDPSLVQFVPPPSSTNSILGSFFGAPLTSQNGVSVVGNLQLTDSLLANGTLVTLNFRAIAPGNAVFVLAAKLSNTDPDIGRTGFVLANGTYLPTTVGSPIAVAITGASSTGTPTPVPTSAVTPTPGPTATPVATFTPVYTPTSSSTSFSLCGLMGGVEMLLLTLGLAGLRSYSRYQTRNRRSA